MNTSELKPFTYIKCRYHVKYSTDKLRGGETYLFMGWITNSEYSLENAVLLDERGVFTAYLGEEDFEVR